MLEERLSLEEEYIFLAGYIHGNRREVPRLLGRFFRL